MLLSKNRKSVTKDTTNPELHPLFDGCIYQYAIGTLNLNILSTNKVGTYGITNIAIGSQRATVALQ